MDSVEVHDTDKLKELLEGAYQYKETIEKTLPKARPPTSKPPESDPIKERMALKSELQRKHFTEVAGRALAAAKQRTEEEARIKEQSLEVLLGDIFRCNNTLIVDIDEYLQAVGHKKEKRKKELYHQWVTTIFDPVQEHIFAALDNTDFKKLAAAKRQSFTRFLDEITSRKDIGIFLDQERDSYPRQHWKGSHIRTDIQPKPLPCYPSERSARMELADSMTLSARSPIVSHQPQIRPNSPSQLPVSSPLVQSIKSGVGIVSTSFGDEHLIAVSDDKAVKQPKPRFKKMLDATKWKPTDLYCSMHRDYVGARAMKGRAHSPGHEERIRRDPKTGIAKPFALFE
ncbi:hypothetical protein ADUPG1_007964 [Aduncisulcus paluster]|uniref:Uncharacterized protein n=1 Tax=Aduncisulcus paluster TaxID=2918883 RepID=A0ABQ5KTD2_9EUKA|nr:hypothetical protein ADUPG1_007964 [Aduncisulcus paluster]